MHHAGLNRRVGPGGADRFRQSSQSVTAHDQSVSQASVSQLGEHGRPLLGSFTSCGAQPQAQDVSFAGQVDAVNGQWDLPTDGQQYCPVAGLSETLCMRP